jgi:NAD(P)-dependent dehydrogenase (short-subunit alcohol dehydrogenase family)
LRFENKVAVVTGGNRGIGWQVVTKLASEGAKVVIIDLNQSNGVPLDNESDSVNQNDSSEQNLIWSLKVDISSKNEVDRAFQKIYKKFGRVEILVNSAGICASGRVIEITEAQWDRMMAVNIKGTLFCSQAVYNIMANRKYGKIINFSSISGKRAGITAGAHYAVSKAAVIMLTRCLARELAEYQVNVNAIAPAFTDTPINNFFIATQIQEVIEGIPLGRIAVPEEMANIALFLASDEAAFITGEVVNVNGGSLMD